MHAINIIDLQGSVAVTWALNIHPLSIDTYYYVGAHTAFKVWLMTVTNLPHKVEMSDLLQAGQNRAIQRNKSNNRKIQICAISLLLIYWAAAGSSRQQQAAAGSQQQQSQKCIRRAAPVRRAPRLNSMCSCHCPLSPDVPFMFGKYLSRGLAFGAELLPRIGGRRTEACDRSIAMPAWIDHPQYKMKTL